MKKYYSSIMAVMFLLVLPLCAEAQTTTPAGNSFTTEKSIVDSLLTGRDIFQMLSEYDTGRGSVSIVQSWSVRATVDYYISKAAERKLMGFRVRIFFDNSQNARDKSLEVATQFTTKYPEIPSYRSYGEPYFRVTVGDFRTKSEAEKFKRQIEKEYPSLFIVTEEINYPEL